MYVVACAAAGCKSATPSLIFFIYLKYVYSWFIICYVHAITAVLRNSAPFYEHQIDFISCRAHRIMTGFMAHQRSPC